MTQTTGEAILAIISKELDRLEIKLKRARDRADFLERQITELSIRKQELTDQLDLV